MIKIADNHIVSIRYSMRNSEDLVLENTLQSDPVSYLQGGKGILPLLQKQLEGLQAGDKKLVYLYKADGFTAEDFVFDIIIDEVRPASDEEIALGYPLPADVKNCGEACECHNNK